MDHFSSFCRYMGHIDQQHIKQEFFTFLSESFDVPSNKLSSSSLIRRFRELIIALMVAPSCSVMLF